jgi:hypothetical protein
MGESILIPALVVIVIGGIGSVRGAFVAATAGGVGGHHRPGLCAAAAARHHVPRIAADLGPADLLKSSMYALMAVLAFRCRAVCESLSRLYAARRLSSGLPPSNTAPSRWIVPWLSCWRHWPCLPPLQAALGQDFYIGFMRRVLIFALAAARA